MAAVLRVKRKATSSPEEMLIISRKRQKAESSSDADETTTVHQTILHFAGTITDPTEDVAQYVAKVLPNLDTEKVRGAKRTLPCDTASNVSGKVSKLTGLDSITDRFKVVNCQRSMDTSSEESTKDKWMTLIDIEDSWSISKTDEKDEKEETSSDDILDSIKKKEQVKKDMEEYVYDLYCVQTYNDIWIESDQIMIQYPEYLDPEHCSDEDKSSIDSNSESHWRNDYPDTDSETDSDTSEVMTPDFYSDDDMCETDMEKRYNYDEILNTFRRISKLSKEEETSDSDNESFGVL